MQERSPLSAVSIIESRPTSPALPQPDRKTADAVRRIGQRVDDVHGRRIGNAAAVMVDRQTGEGRWLLVAATPDLHVAVPLDGLLSGGGRVWCPHPHKRVMSGPHIGAVEGITARTEKRICETFGLEPTAGARRAGWERRRVTSVLEATPTGFTWKPEPRAIVSPAAAQPRR